MGFTHLYGSDYSAGAIQVAEKYVKSEGLEENIKLFVDDALDSKIEEQFEVVFDKGMLDALILSPTDAMQKQHLYFQTLKKLVSPDGVLIISSCNLTNDELTTRLQKYNFEEQERIKYKVIKFGGHSGSSLATICFKHSPQSK